MTLAKTCHASNMMQDLVEATHIAIVVLCLNRDVSIVSLLNWKKIESHFETWSSDAQRIHLTFVAYSFVANFVRYISAKYYLNFFKFYTVVMKVLGVNFFLKHSVYWQSVSVVLHAWWNLNVRKHPDPSPFSLNAWVSRQTGVSFCSSCVINMSLLLRLLSPPLLFLDHLLLLLLLLLVLKIKRTVTMLWQ